MAAGQGNGRGPQQCATMRMARVVVISPSRTLGTALVRRLASARFEVIDVEPGPDVVKAICRDRPGIAVIDRIDERPEAAQLEIAVLKELWPGVEIIALSASSSEADASIVEQGVFYYTAAAPVDEVIRVIHAAERAAISRWEERT